MKNQCRMSTKKEALMCGTVALSFDERDSFYLSEKWPWWPENTKHLDSVSWQSLNHSPLCYTGCRWHSQLEHEGQIPACKQNQARLVNINLNITNMDEDCLSWDLEKSSSKVVEHGGLQKVAPMAKSCHACRWQWFSLCLLISFHLIGMVCKELNIH